MSSPSKIAIGLTGGLSGEMVTTRPALIPMFVKTTLPLYTLTNRTFLTRRSSGSRPYAALIWDFSSFSLSPSLWITLYPLNSVEVGCQTNIPYLS